MYWWATLLLIFIGGQKDKWLKPGCYFVSITVIRFGRTQQIWSSQRRTAARCTLRLGHPDNDGDQDGDDDDDDEHDDDIIMKMNMVMVMVKLMIQSTKMMVDLEKQVLSNDNFMTVLVRFQLIFLNDIKYPACRELSPYRPYQELISNDIFIVSWTKKRF